MAEKTTLARDVFADVATALAAPGCAAQDLLAPVADHLIATYELGLVTVTYRDTTDGSFLRLFSSMPDAYEAQGRKPANETDWSQHVITDQKTFVANDYEGMARVMYDHEKIRSLGLESILNIPIVVSGDVVGTLNCLGPDGHMSGDIIAGCEAMRLAVAVALQLEKSRMAERG